MSSSNGTDPIFLTQEEIDQIVKDIQSSTYNKNYGWTSEWDYEYWENEKEPEVEEPKCRHEWVTEKYFSNNQYTTCKHCGARKEKGEG